MATRLFLLLLLVATGPACTQDPAEDEAFAKLAELEGQLQKARELERELPALEAEIAAAEATVDELDAALVADEADALARLRTTLERCGFGIVDIRSRGVSETDDLRSIRFDVEAVTPFSAGSKVFEALAVQPLLVVVEELSMKRDGDRARLAFTVRLGLAAGPD